MTDDPAVRVEALEALLVEKGLVDPELVDEIVEHYEDDVGPLNGARVVARAWAEPAYQRRACSPTARPPSPSWASAAPQGDHIVAVENTPAVHNVVVCTLCSCYPWPVLGLPPGWYKSPRVPRRAWSREPRAVLREMGLEFADDVRVRVWDSSAEVRYLVVPERPAGTEGLAEEELARLVTRDAMIGVAPGAGARCLTRSPTTSRRPTSPPRNNGEICLAAPWERRAFGLTIGVVPRRSAATGRPSANA